MIQFQSRPLRVRHETFQETRRITMPLNRVPTLSKIVEQFESGRPIDANVQRNLEYNDFERMPIYQKGFDIIDAYKVAKQNGENLDKLNDEIRSAIDAAKTPPQPTQNPVTEPPKNLNE